MDSANKIRAVRGVRDILPPDTALWNWFERAARDVLEAYNFREIRLPIFEETELFARSVGAETDIVSKEMYTFTDRDETAISLRPEATASVVRAYIEHGMHTWPGLVKLYYSGPMFRRERPQKGRYRQFYQIGAEVLGPSDHPAIDAEMIEMLIALIERCRLDQWALLVNSIGDPQCRPAYVALLKDELRKVKDRLGPDSQRRIDTNPLRVLDSKLPEEQAVIEALPRITDHLCKGCRAHFVELRRQLDLRSVPYRHEPRLVRGLDYYVRTTFEITSPHLGAQNALAGGGRYDGLAELLGGPPAKGVGFALGEDRFIEVIQAGGQIDVARPLDAFIVWMGQPAYPAAARLARRLRLEGLSIELPPEESKLKKALGLAERLGAQFAVIVGEKEVAAGEYAVKRLADGLQRSLAEGDVAGFVKSSGKAARPAESPAAKS
ncbi:MAG TPA: histidine--tRNA ligase [Candidatus Acidoferrales bacterium]|nr:histidine--tRNA ligase [Candidatus Acidoferrales bacterium]